MARQPKAQPAPRRCDWMTDEQLLRWIEVCSGYLAEALAEQRDRTHRPSSYTITTGTGNPGNVR